MDLIIDNREKSIINNFSDTEINFKLENLNIGDIHFYYNKELILLIERKTMADLASSIKDGRHREQKFRLKNHQNQCKVLYLYEGKPCDFNYQKVTKETLISAINNTFIRDGFYVKETKDVNDTINFLIQMYNKIKKLGESNKLNSSNKNTEYIDFLKMKKNTLIDEKNSYIMQLSQIPGVSKTIAESISWKYTSMIQLCREINESNENILTNLMIATSGKPRKLGKKLSETIYKYLGKNI